MPDTSMPETRNPENLRGVKMVSLNIVVDLENEMATARERIRRDINIALRDMIESTGLDLSKQAPQTPQLTVFTSIRVFRERSSNQILIAYRVETFLRENISLRFNQTDPDDALFVDSWRHRAELNLVPFDAARDESTSQALDEVMQQVKCLVADWAQANPQFAREAPGERDNLAALIDGVGPVFEQRLNSSGIRNAQQLARLTDDEIQLLAPLFSITDAAGATIGSTGEVRLKDFREKAQDLLTN